MAEDVTRYNRMENVLSQINRDFIALPDEEVARNNEILNPVLELITNAMRANDDLFNEMFNGDIFFGGSYFDGLKISRPDEYDVDLLLKLSPAVVTRLIESDVPGFVHLEFLEYVPHLRNYSKPYGLPPRHYQRSGPPAEFRGFQKLINDNTNCLHTDKVRNWMERVVGRALNTFRRVGRGIYEVCTPSAKCFARMQKSGPAFTLTVENSHVYFNVDLVACFVFDQNYWPRNFREYSFPEKPNFFIVPKSPKNIPNATEYWALSFQMQERHIMKGMEKLKPTIRLIKKMRDVYADKDIASYFIKTVALWISDEKDPSFWSQNSLSYVFMTVLKKYRHFLGRCEIPYYWNPEHNLLENVDSRTLKNLYNRLGRVIRDVDRNLNENRFVIAKYLLTNEEQRDLRSHYEDD